jgi:hypothetical protein
MSSEPLDNLVKTHVLKAEPPDQAEFDGLLKLGTNRLKDAGNEDNSPESRFDLAYNAAHALSLAAMRWHGYRPDRQRFIVFQALQHTLNLPPAQWRVLDKAHNSRNLAEYEGNSDVDEQLLAEVLKVAEVVRKKVVALGPIPQPKKKS